MTLEVSPAKVEAKSASTDTSATSGKSAAHGKKVPGGFMSILASLDVPTSAVGADGADDRLRLSNMLGEDPANSADASLLASLPDVDLASAGLGGKLTDLKASPTDSASGLADASLAFDPMSLLAQAGHLVATVPTPTEGARLSATADARPGPIGSDVRKPDMAATAGLKVDKGESDLVPKRKLPDLKTAPQADDSALGTDAQQERKQLDARAVQFQSLEKAVNAGTKSELVVPIPVAAKPEERRTKEWAVKGQVAENAPSALAVSAPSVGAVDASATTGGVPTETYVGEKVQYWISHGIQNAEMQLDGIGLNPVEVSISMNGNEAQVAFRTDELQARSVLENASDHLKDMLQREGVLLTGVSVDSSRSGDAGAQERRSRQGAREITVPVAAGATDKLVGVASRTIRGTVDLFV